MPSPESHRHANGIRIFDYPQFALKLRDRVRDRAAADRGGRVVYGITSQPVAAELANMLAAATTGSARTSRGPGAGQRGGRQRYWPVGSGGPPNTRPASQILAASPRRSCGTRASRCGLAALLALIRPFPTN